jgi:tetratricopeptide (TPR) repeat protein
MRAVAAILLPAALVLGLVLGLGASAVRADQNDPRLEELFGKLKGAGDFRSANVVEMTIWHIWVDSEDEVVRQLMGQGLEAMARRDYRAALGKFDQIVKIAPDYAEGWNKRATVLYLLGDFVESLHDIDRTLKLEPRHFGALSGRGLVYVELRDETRALESFEAALDIHPNLPGASMNARALRRRIGDREI